MNSPETSPMSQTATPVPTAIRITEVLDYFCPPYLVEWKMRVGKREANAIAKAAMKVGSRVDELIKNAFTLGEGCDELLKKEPETVNNCIKAFDKWVQVYNPVSITPCSRIVKEIEGHLVTGEPDLIVDGVLVDIKCSSRISLSYWFQVNMYAYLRGDIEKVAILRLDKKTGSYEYVEQSVSQVFVDAWIGMMMAYVLYKGEVEDDECSS